MPRSLIFALAAAFALTGCVTLHHRDREFLQDHHITGALYDKMSRHEPLTLDEIIDLSQRGIPGPFIVHYLRPTYYVYKLNTDDVARLKQSGVADGVIHYLLSTPAQFSPSQAPVWYDDDPHFHDPYWDWRRY